MQNHVKEEKNGCKLVFMLYYPMSRITVTTKVNEDECERLKEIAVGHGMSLSGYLKSLCEKELKQDSSMQDQLNEIAFLYDINGENLVKNVRWLLDSGKLFVREGRLCWNPLAMNEGYISVDDKIDSMKLSEKEKNRLKSEILSTLESQKDLTGNGGGL